MANISKVVYGNTTLIDLTTDTVTPETLALGVKAHDKSGELITGVMPSPDDPPEFDLIEACTTGVFPEEASADGFRCILSESEYVVRSEQGSFYIECEEEDVYVFNDTSGDADVVVLYFIGGYICFEYPCTIDSRGRILSNHVCYASVGVDDDENTATPQDLVKGKVAWTLSGVIEGEYEPLDYLDILEIFNSKNCPDIIKEVSTTDERTGYLCKFGNSNTWVSCSLKNGSSGGFDLFYGDVCRLYYRHPDTLIISNLNGNNWASFSISNTIVEYGRIPIIHAIDSLDMQYDETDSTAEASDIALGKKAYVNNTMITGTHVEPTFTTEEKIATPTESLQTITPTSADGLSKVTVNAISSTYVGSGVTRQGAKTVTPTKSSQTAVASGVYTTGAISVGAIPSNYVDVSGSTNVSAGNLLTGTKAYNSSGTLVTGNMANNGANNVTISSKSGATIPSGYYNGSGKAVIDSTSSTNLVEDNIKKGISILGITGTFEGGGGSSNIKSGSASLTTSSSTTNIKITDTSTIGFTPKAFFVWADTNQTSRYYVNSSYFITQGSGYRRSTLYRGSSSDSVLNATTTWTTSTSGYLYFNSNTIYFRNTSSYRVATATYRWIALTW